MHFPRIDFITCLVFKTQYFSYNCTNYPDILTSQVVKLLTNLQRQVQVRPQCLQCPLPFQSFSILTSWKSNWLIPLSHSWYCNDQPSSCLKLDYNWQNQTVTACFRRAHLSSLKNICSRKCFAPCIKCYSAQASAEHILDSMSLTEQDLSDRSALLLDFLKVNNFMDII